MLHHGTSPYPPRHASLGFLGNWDFHWVQQCVDIFATTIWSQNRTLGQLVFGVPRWDQPSAMALWPQIQYPGYLQMGTAAQG